MPKFALLLVSVTAFATLGCAGTRRTPDTFFVHAESIRVLSIPIPRDDQEAAWRQYVEEVGVGGEVRTVTSTAADWTSISGALGNLFWIHRTTISGVIVAPDDEGDEITEE